MMHGNSGSFFWFFCADDFLISFPRFFLICDSFFLPVKNRRITGNKKILMWTWDLPHIRTSPTGSFSTRKKGVNSDRKNPESGHSAGFDFWISPKWAPFKWKWPPVRSKTPGLFAWTGGPEYVRQRQERLVSQFEKIHYSEPNSASDCQFSDSVFGFFGIGVHR